MQLPIKPACDTMEKSDRRLALNAAARLQRNKGTLKYWMTVRRDGPGRRPGAVTRCREVAKMIRDDHATLAAFIETGEI